MKSVSSINFPSLGLRHWQTMNESANKIPMLFHLILRMSRQSVQAVANNKRSTSLTVRTGESNTTVGVPKTVRELRQLNCGYTPKIEFGVFMG